MEWREGEARECYTKTHAHIHSVCKTETPLYSKWPISQTHPLQLLLEPSLIKVTLLQERNGQISASAKEGGRSVDLR